MTDPCFEQIILDAPLHQVALHAMPRHLLVAADALPVIPRQRRQVRDLQPVLVGQALCIVRLVPARGRLVCLYCFLLIPEL